MHINKSSYKLLCLLNEYQVITTFYSRGAMYSITPDGTAYIENKKSEKVKFLIGSVVIPMPVAFITSLTTVIVAIKL